MDKQDRPVVIVGFVASALAALSRLQPEGSVVFVEEPDVIRKRGVSDTVGVSPLVRELVAWEFHQPGKADEFYHRYADLDPVAVIPFTEYATPFAARLAERYGLPGAGFGAAQIMRDKEMLRRVSRATGVANPDFTTVTGPGQVLEFLLAGDGPIVLKPANRQASVGTQVIHDAGEVANAWMSCVDQDEGVYVPDRPMELRMLAERFVEGTEYSVEMLVRDGTELFANVTGKLLFPGPRPVELAHVVPADAAAETRALLAEQTRRVVAATGFRDGIVHCEWILADGVPHLVECAGRFAGDGIIELIQRAYPIELNRAYFAVMKGEPLPVELPTRAATAAAVRFLSIQPGVVETVDGIDDARAVDGVFQCDVNIAPGDRFTGLRSSWDRVGEVMVTADSPAGALRLADVATSLIRIDMRSADRVSELDTAAP